MKKKEKLLVHQYVAKFFYTDGITFNVRNNFNCHVMCEAIESFDFGYVPPTVGRPQGSLLEGIDELRGKVKKHEAA